MDCIISLALDSDENWKSSVKRLCSLYLAYKRCQLLYLIPVRYKVSHFLGPLALLMIGQYPYDWSLNVVPSGADTAQVPLIRASDTVPSNELCKSKIVRAVDILGTWG